MSESAAQVFRHWKNQEITQAVFRDLEVRRDVLAAELAAQAGIDPLRDRFVVGYITAVNDLLQVTVEEIQQDD